MNEVQQKRIDLFHIEQVLKGKDLSDISLICVDRDIPGNIGLLDAEDYAGFLEHAETGGPSLREDMVNQEAAGHFENDIPIVCMQKMELNGAPVADLFLTSLKNLRKQKRETIERN